jgi:hypothetical protein
MESDTLPQSLSVRPNAGYWSASRQPLSSLIFIAPLLICYEVGAVALRVQNGADAWMRKLLDVVGFGQHFLLPMLTVGILLGWHHVTRHTWRVSARVLSTMVAECLLLAIALRLILQLQGALLQSIAGPVTLSLGAKCREAVGFMGAGVYEELLFRLVMLSVAIWLFVRLGAAMKLSMIAAVLLTSVVFAAAHYVGAYGEAFHWFTFLFRFLAGVFFSILFVCRGFGIAAGTHAVYDILVGLL